jgi:hypothetical protein
MILNKKSNPSKKNLRDYIYDISNFFAPSVEVNPTSLISISNLQLDVPLIEWNENDLIEKESFLKQSYFPISVKISLNDGRVIYIIAKSLLYSGHPALFESEFIKTVDSLDYVIKNILKEDQIIRLKFKSGRDLYFVSEDFYLSSLETN